MPDEQSGEISRAKLHMFLYRIIASPSYGEVSARESRSDGEGEKNKERPLSRQQVAYSSP